MDENSDSDLYDHKVMTSHIPDNSENHQINEHTDISTPSLKLIQMFVITIHLLLVR